MQDNIPMPQFQPLSGEEIYGFIHDGFVRIDNAFTRETAKEARAILWRDTGCDPNDRSTWTQPVIRLGGYSDPPFQAVASAPKLVAAFDQIVGAGRWIPRDGLGTFPVRFPSSEDPGDSGWHVDASFPPAPDEADQSYFAWRVNVHSKGRALLMLFLFSDVGEYDAPTRIRKGSHLDVARILAPAGESGMASMELAQRLEETAHRPEALAAGEAGTVYLCHPFLVHAAQPHRGNEPRFMAQPPLLMTGSFGDDSPAQQAIRIALEK
jgi:phytanoyl-CoA dioxygenase PhyH